MDPRPRSGLEEAKVSDPRRLRLAVDVLVAGVLGVLAAVHRLPALPKDGLWFDDAWVAVGALHGSTSQLPVRGSAHPGFTLLVQLWDGVTGSAPNGLAVPALVAGVLGPPVVYLGLRWLRFAPSIAGLLAAVLVVADIHATYSGRVKSYTFDTAGIMVIAVLLPSLSSRRWGWRTAAGWVLAAFVASSLSGYLMVGTALAVGILVLHPRSDLRVRLTAAVAQGSGQFAMYLAARSTTDLDEIEAFMESTYDGHLSVYRDPVTMTGQVLDHLGRVVDAYTGGPLWLLAPLGILALLALSASALGWPNRDRTVTSRYLLVCVAFAFVGGVFNRFPFGPATRNWSAEMNASGGRHSLWLVAVLVVGLALVMEPLRTVLTARKRWSTGFDAGAVATAVLVLALSWKPVPSYMAEHSLSTAHFVDRAAGQDGLVIGLGAAAYLYASSTDRHLALLETPENMVGFSPEGEDGRFVAVGLWATRPYDATTIRRLAADEPRVVLAATFLGPGSPEVAIKALEADGFVVSDQLWRDNAYAVVMDHPG